MSAEADEPEIAVTGNFWLGRGTRSIWSVVKETILNSRREVGIAAYAIGEASDEYEFLGLLQRTLAKGIAVLLIVNRFQKQPASVRKKLRDLGSKYKSLVLKDFSPSDRREDLHAKLIVVDHDVALVGSANLSFKGMVANHEVIVKLTGETAYSIGLLIDRLAEHSETVVGD